MKNERKFRLLLATSIAITMLASAATAAPWENLLSANRVEADPSRPYNLTQENGPWMILACSFSGENARADAHALVIELRKRYKLPAYVYEKEFDYGDEVQGRGIDEYGQPLKMRYQRGNEFTEVAVMVGDYPAVDDHAAQATLQKLKYYEPECLKLSPDKATTRSLAALRLVQQTVLAPGNEKKERGPMGHAMVTTNPLLPQEYFAPKGIDSFVLALNKNEQYNLLQCPGKYTVRVAHFTGRVVLDQADIKAIEEGREMKSQLVKAGEKAERLTQALRMNGYEAYVFHDRGESIVTVGSFNSVGTPRTDGKIEINPQIHKIMKVFGAEPVTLPNGVPSGMRPKTFVGIPFDIQPLPVEVPQRSFACDYAR